MKGLGVSKAIRTESIVMKEYDPVWGNSVYYFDTIEEAKKARAEIKKNRDEADKVDIRITIYDIENDKVY